MAKDSFWFKHDYNARNDDKIMELRSVHGAESYGIYWMIVESMADTSCGGINKKLLGGLAHGFGVAKARLIEIIKNCEEVGLFYEKDDYYFSNRMLEHKKEREYFSDMGKIGAEKKRALRGALRGLNRAEESRGEKILAISFENDFAVFPDGTKQKLGKSQIFSMKHDDLKPEQVFKGIIY